METPLILVCGSWTVATVVTTAFYGVYPAEARRLRAEVQKRRAQIGG